MRILQIAQKQKGTMRFPLLSVFLLGLCSTGITSQSLSQEAIFSSVEAGTVDEEEAHAVALGVTGGIYLGSSVAGLAPSDPVTGLAIELVGYTANMALKFLPAAFIPPADITRFPNDFEQCDFEFSIPQSYARYSNLYGATVTPLPEDWGELTSSGQPDLSHFGTDVIVGARSAYIDTYVYESSLTEILQSQADLESFLALTNAVNVVDFKDDDIDPSEGFNNYNFSSLAVFPAGNHSVNWEAKTVVDWAMDATLPLALAAVRYEKAKNAPVLPKVLANNLDEADDAIDVVTLAARYLTDKLSIPVKACKDKCPAFIAEKSALYAFDKTTGFEDYSISKRAIQQLSVYDVHIPELTINNPILTLEATDVGGALTSRVRSQILGGISTTDKCGRTPRLGNDLPELLDIGENLITWTSSDLGPTPSGGGNSVTKTQTIIIEDTQAPLMITPAGKVIEVDPTGENATGFDLQDIVLGSPRVVDLADPMPTVSSTAPDFFPIDSRTGIEWSATDQSGNSATGTQLVTVKTIGTNTPPTVNDVTANTLTSQPVDIVLSGIDNDFLDGVFDPLSISIATRPEHGEFVAPLLPYFIEDYRTAVEGPYGQGFAITGNQSNWFYNNICQEYSSNNRQDLFDLYGQGDLSETGSQKIRRDWVYKPRYVHVLDNGTYFMIDRYWRCDSSNASTYERISKWDANGEFLGQTGYNGTNDAFVYDQSGLIYTLTRSNSGSSTELFLTQIDPNFDDPSSPEIGTDSWKFTFASTENDELGLDDPVSNNSYSYVRADSKNGLIYLTDRRRVFVFDAREDFADLESNSRRGSELYRGALKNAEQFLCVESSNYGSSWTGFAMEVDSEGALYIADSCDDRIHKFDPPSFDQSDQVVLGEYVGWMGRCIASTNNACDIENQKSRGYSCTNETCSAGERYILDPESGNTVDATLGTEPGQFSQPVYLSLDVNDILYVADSGRVQRFSPDGTFAGEAKSTGTGINQGERPGFVLGNLGTVKAVSVNSTQFFVVDQQESFIHVFETTPLKDITDNSATVTYVSDFNFHSGIDTFTYQASDGLAPSNVSAVSVQVDRNFRAPEAFGETINDVIEDTSYAITLKGDDPDGVIGTDDVFPLDNLSFRLVDQPRNGILTSAIDGAVIDDASMNGPDLLYTPSADYHGTDTFTFVTNDGVEDSPLATYNITILPVNDAPRVEELVLPNRIGAGFPFVARVDFRDDGSDQALVVSGTWGNKDALMGELVDEDGEGGNPPVMTGLIMNESPLPWELSSVIGMNTYDEPGPQLLIFCVYDNEVYNDNTAGFDCVEQSIDVESLVNLELEVSADELSSELGFIDVEINLENMTPNTYNGLEAKDLVLTSVDSDAFFVDSIISQTRSSADEETTDSIAVCSVEQGKLNCADSSMATGESFSLILRLKPITLPTGTLRVPFAIEGTTSTQSVEEVYTEVLWVTFDVNPNDSDADGMPNDFETAYFLNPNDPADAELDADSDGLSNLDEYLAGSNPVFDEQPPVLSIPANISVNATGLLTAVDIGIATANDAKYGELTAVASYTGPFESGRNEVLWTATDDDGNAISTIQVVDVFPLVHLTPSSLTSEGGIEIIEVQLSGVAPVYPVTVDYSISGNASNPLDHDAQSASLRIEEGLSASVPVNIVLDALDESPEDIVITLDFAQNAVLGAQIARTIQIVEENLAPSVRLVIEQDGINGALIAANKGLVRVSALIDDANLQDTHSYDWTETASDLVDLDENESSFSFDPTGLSGVYELGVSVTDNGSPSLGDENTAVVLVLAQAPLLSDTEDSDGDGLRDTDEGYGDTDADGISNYLDSTARANLVPLTNDISNAQASLFLQAEPGTKLSIGALAFSLAKATASVSESDVAAVLGSLSGQEDADYAYPTGLYDVNVSGKLVGASYQLVIPLTEPIADGVSFRQALSAKASLTNGWQAFVENADNTLFSALAAQGACPAVGSSAYTAGLIEGYNCIQLLIEDGGLNDSDGASDGTINLTTGLAFLEATNGTPSETASTIELASTRLDANGSDSTVVTVTAIDTQGSALEGAALSAALTGASANISDFVEQGLGVYTATLTAGTNAGTLLVRVTISNGTDSVEIVSQTLTISAVNTPPSSGGGNDNNGGSGGGSNNGGILILLTLCVIYRYHRSLHSRE